MEEISLSIKFSSVAGSASRMVEISLSTLSLSVYQAQ